MRIISKFRFGLAALMLACIVASSCAREDVEYEGAAIPAKESAIYKHIAEHKKERTRSGDVVKLEPVIYEGDTVMYTSVSYYFRANWGKGQLALDPEISGSLFTCTYSESKYKAEIMIN